ncbi:HpcH/HpaI aldolase/citrate lyase family protein [Haloplanus pelagicus]|jgi:citrate lyase subunit beta/citryl-CoA lyase|uniref:HpcH/HpaI aldolase/citrate lyase family protein n=1 Tax=Haloplanus pelagicus TaxID=2949995 RepID=UPI00203FABE5|nr:CoA ester lyase [Haloplanus sp. HW8-1]
MARRTVLFSPGDRPELCRKAPATGADTVVFDLEDAVAPARKAEARAAVADLLADPEFDPAGVEVAVRIGAADAATADLDALTDRDLRRLDAVMMPKATVESVRAVADALSAHDLSVPVIALIETATGILDAPEVAALGVVDALGFGAEDLSADLGATRTAEGTEVLYARERVVVAARAAGVEPIDTVYTDLDDAEGLRSETTFAATLGYDGKMVIHPDQVPIVAEAFAPDSEEVAWARRVLAAREAADDDRGVFEVDGEMIDAPLLARAERILDRATETETETE